MKFQPATRTSTLEETVAAFSEAGYPPELIKQVWEESRSDELYLSDCGTYQVQVRRDAPNQFGTKMTWLSIKRIDREAIHDWRDLQAIKNALVGPENEAIEIYPAESRLVDSSNQYHLWVFNDPKIRIPTGFPTRMVTDTPVRNTKQRPFR